MDPEQRLASLREQQASFEPPQRGDQAPTRQEINTQQAGMKTAEQIRDIYSQNQADAWYPEGLEESRLAGAEATPMLEKIINTSLTPLYGVVGAADHALGNSDSGSLLGSIDDNINDKRRTFGDITGNGVTGLTADIVFDPVNWLTMGTAALVPRVGAGILKGGARGGVRGAAKGAGAAAESRVLESMLMTGNLAKGTAKLGAAASSYANPMRYWNKATKQPVKAVKQETKERSNKFMDWVQNRSENATKAFDDAVGQDAIERMVRDKAPVGLVWRHGMKELADRAVQKAPFLNDYFEKYWKYSNKDWTRITQLRDALMKTAGKDMDDGVQAYLRSRETGEEFEEALARLRPERQRVASAVKPDVEADPLAAAEKAMPEATTQEMQKAVSALRNKVETEDVTTFTETVSDANQAAKIAKDPDMYVTYDDIENALRMAEESKLIDRNNIAGLMDDLNEVIRRGDFGETGIKWWDDIKQQLRSYENAVRKANEKGGKASLKARVGDKASRMLDVYGLLISGFKRMAVGSSPTAWTNAVLGNLAMAKMVGLDVIDPAWMKSMQDADKILRNKKGSELLLEEMFEVSDMFEYLRDNPSAFEAATSLGSAPTTKLMQARHMVDKVKKVGIDSGVLPKDVASEDVLTLMQDLIEEGSKSASEAVAAVKKEVGKDMQKIIAEGYEAQVQSQARSAYGRTLNNLAEDGSVSNVNTTDWASNELFQSETANKIFSDLRKKAESGEGNLAHRLGDKLFNWLPEQYGQLDYNYKLGSTLYAVREGVKEGELRIIGRMLDLNAEDVKKVTKDGVTRYRLSTDKAMQLSQEAFLNYNAMPAVVKLLRNLPLVGAPFAAFTYGMYTKTAKTMATNPAFFNKTQMFLEEMGGEETPIEKGLLNMDRYKYLDDPAMVNIPTFGDNMVYMNLANILPYYTLSMVQPPNRRYEGVLPNTMIQTLDRLPVMQDPVGSTIFDFLILPHLIGEELPQGTFGQAIYPENASALEKAGYMGRSLADPFVPGVLQPGIGLGAGLLESSGALPMGSAQKLPGYRTRVLAEAIQGNTAVGVQSKEPAASRTMRGLSGALGVPIQSPVPYTYLDEEEALRDNN